MPPMPLRDNELRVLGCLIEKSMTTPEYYPLSLNALLAACNQRSNREPVVAYDEATVVEALDGLRERGLCRSVQRPGQRTGKYRHAVDEVLHVDDEQAAVLAVLMLRGPQTLGEVRTRTERYHEFASLAEVADVLGGLASRAEPLAERLERRPGEKEPRYGHLLGMEDEAGAPEADGEGVPAPVDEDRVASLSAEVAELRAQVDSLRARLDALAESLGEPTG
jgi:uncharacterized protein YceH (UPF0502 family)